MAIYLKKFENHTQYETYTASTEFITPNVSLCVNENEVHYNPIPIETRVVAKFNVTDTSRPTPIGYYQYISGFSEIEIDGVVQTAVTSAYTFSMTGEHTVKYTLTDPTSIGNNAFTKCSGMTSIVVPDGVTSINYAVFSGCTSLTSIDIPNSVTTIGNSTFSKCSGLTSIDIPDGVTTIGYNAFNECSGLTSIDIPDGVTTIGYGVFYNCISLTSCTIGSGVTSIGSNAFKYCRLTSINIPSGVTSIGSSAFQGCSRLTSATVNAITPPSLGTDAFSNNPSERNIYVPSASVNDYKAATNWSTYASRIQAIS